jgi:hypothetical protein
MQINYSDKTWCYKLPETEKEWDALVVVFESLNVNVYELKYNPMFTHIFCSYDDHIPCLVRVAHSKNLREVSFYEMINILTAPTKTEQEIQIEQLQDTIDKAAIQIKIMQTGIKQCQLITQKKTGF